jgi:hypothetical protein
MRSGRWVELALVTQLVTKVSTVPPSTGTSSAKAIGRRAEYVPEG